MDRLYRRPVAGREQVDHVEGQVVADHAGGEDFEGECNRHDIPRAQTRGGRPGENWARGFLNGHGRIIAVG